MAVGRDVRADTADVAVATKARDERRAVGFLLILGSWRLLEQNCTDRVNDQNIRKILIAKCRRPVVRTCARRPVRLLNYSLLVDLPCTFSRWSVLLANHKSHFCDVSEPNCRRPLPHCCKTPHARTREDDVLCQRFCLLSRPEQFASLNCLNCETPSEAVKHTNADAVCHCRSRQLGSAIPSMCRRCSYRCSSTERAYLGQTALGPRRTMLAVVVNLT